MNTPLMKPGNIEMVSVEWLLQNISNSVDFDRGINGVPFRAMVAKKGRDPQMNALLHKISTEGFRLPIVLCSDEEEFEWTLGNGHHRFVAAILLMMEEIPVFWSVYSGRRMRDDFMREDISTDCDEEGEEIDDYEWWDNQGDFQGISELFTFGKFCRMCDEKLSGVFCKECGW